MFNIYIYTFSISKHANVIVSFEKKKIAHGVDLIR